MPLSEPAEDVIQPGSFTLDDNADANAAQANITYIAQARPGHMLGSGGELGGVVKYPRDHHNKFQRDTDGETPRLYQVEKKSDAEDPTDPSVGENVQDRHLVTRAVASSELDKLLQLGVVSEEKFGVDDQNRVFGISVMADGAGIQSEFRAEGPGSPKIGCFLNVDYSNPVIQKGLSDLEVSDYISGQIDRHAGNIFVDGTTGKVTGIDNDLSFPEASRETIQARETDRLGSTNNKSVAGMPRQIHADTRNKILAVDPDVMRQTLAGIRPPNGPDNEGGLTEAEIEGAVGRLQALQDELRNPRSTIQVVTEFNDATYEAALEAQKAKFNEVYDREAAGNNRATFDTCESTGNLDQCPKTSYLGSVLLKQKQAQVGIRLDQQDRAQALAEGREPKAPGLGLRPAHETPKAARDVEHAEYVRQLDGARNMLKKNPAAIQDAGLRQQAEGVHQEMAVLREKISRYDRETAKLDEGHAGARLRSLASGGREGRKDFYAAKKLEAEVGLKRLDLQLDGLADAAMTPEFRNGLRQEVGAGRLLVDAGLPHDHVAAMSAQKRVDLLTAVNANAPCSNDLLRMEQAVAAGTMSAQVPDQILSMNRHSPRLAGKIAEIGAQELDGAAPQGITAFVAGNALHDSYYQDKRGTTIENTPTAQELGFEPQMHLQLDQADYDLMKTAVQKFNEQGLMTKMNFDDASRRVDVGYSSEEMAVLRASTAGTELSLKANDIRNCFNKVVAPAPDTHQETHQTLGSRALLDKMQDSRIDTTAAIFKQMNGFDYQPHDQKLNDATSTEIEAKLAEPNITNQAVISNLLTERDMPGFVISENHGQTETKNFITENMEHLAQQGVRVVGIEHLSNPGLQQAVTDYLNDPDPNAVMNADLQAGLRGLKQGKDGIYVNMVQEAKKHGVAVIGIDGPNLRTPDAPGLDSGAIRAAFMNSAGITNLDKKLEELTPPGGDKPKFVLLAGGNHNLSQPGLLETGVPGLGQYYQVPNVSIAPKAGGTEYPMALIRDVPENRQRQAPEAPAVNVAVNQAVPPAVLPDFLNQPAPLPPGMEPPNYPAPLPPGMEPPNYPAPLPPGMEPPNYPAPQPPGQDNLQPAFLNEQAPELPAYLNEQAPELPAYLNEQAPELPAYLNEQAPELPAYLNEQAPDPVRTTLTEEQIDNAIAKYVKPKDLEGTDVREYKAMASDIHANLQPDRTKRMKPDTAAIEAQLIDRYEIMPLNEQIAAAEKALTELQQTEGISADDPRIEAQKAELNELYEDLDNWETRVDTLKASMKVDDRKNRLAGINAAHEAEQAALANEPPAQPRVQMADDVKLHDGNPRQEYELQVSSAATARGLMNNVPSRGIDQETLKSRIGNAYGNAYTYEGPDRFKEDGSKQRVKGAADRGINDAEKTRLAAEMQPTIDKVNEIQQTINALEQNEMTMTADFRAEIVADINNAPEETRPAIKQAEEKVATAQARLDHVEDRLQALDKPGPLERAKATLQHGSVDKAREHYQKEKEAATKLHNTAKSELNQALDSAAVKAMKNTPEGQILAEQIRAEKNEQNKVLQKFADTKEAQAASIKPERVQAPEKNIVFQPGAPEAVVDVKSALKAGANHQPNQQTQEKQTQRKQRDERLKPSVQDALKEHAPHHAEGHGHEAGEGSLRAKWTPAAKKPEMTRSASAPNLGRPKPGG